MSNPILRSDVILGALLWVAGTLWAGRPPVITGFTPERGTCGTRVTVSGSGFVRNPDDALVLMELDGASTIPCRVVLANDAGIVAIPPWDCWVYETFDETRITYRQGTGRQQVFQPDVSPPPRPLGPAFVWSSNARNPSATAAELLQLDLCRMDVDV